MSSNKDKGIEARARAKAREDVYRLRHAGYTDRQISKMGDELGLQRASENINAMDENKSKKIVLPRLFRKKQDMTRLWSFFGPGGGAFSSGYERGLVGSGYIFAYGLRSAKTNYEKVSTVDITSWNGEERTIIGPTMQDVEQALKEMKITETSWEPILKS